MLNFFRPILVYFTAHGYQPVQTTSDLFSAISAILVTFNQGMDTALSSWKRARAYMDSAWLRTGSLIQPGTLACSP